MRGVHGGRVFEEGGGRGCLGVLGEQLASRAPPFPFRRVVVGNTPPPHARQWLPAGAPPPTSGEAATVLLLGGALNRQRLHV